MIWAKTSTKRGGARDPAVAQANRVGHVMEEMAQLDEGGEGATLMSAEGFKAYADDSMWVSAGSAGARGVIMEGLCTGSAGIRGMAEGAGMRTFCCSVANR